MKNLFTSLFLVFFPLVGIAQIEVVPIDDNYVDADTTCFGVADMEARIASLPGTIDITSYMNESLDSLIEAGEVLVDKSDPAYKPGMTYGEYEKASEEYTKNMLKEQLAGYDLPKFTQDFAKDKAILDDYVNRMFSNPQLRAETPTAALIMMVSDENGGFPFGKDMFTLFPYYFQMVMSSFVEFAVYKEMGGKDDKKSEFTRALMSGNVGDVFQEQMLLYPDEYKARVDSISSFLKRLDWLGNIYPNDTLRSREVQDSLVLKCVGDMNEIKADIDQQHALQAFLQNLMSDLYQGKDIVLEDYFTPELCDKIRHKKMKLSVITPSKKWKDWDPQSRLEFSGIEGYFYVCLSKEIFDESNPESYSDDDKQTKDSKKEFYVKIDPKASPLLISDFLSNEDYWKLQEDKYDLESNDYPEDFMPAPPEDAKK